MAFNRHPIHVFKDDNAIGKRGEKIFSRYLDMLGLEYKDVSDVTSYQKQDIDFVVMSKTGKEWTVEVKNDTRIAQTGNIFFETISNVHYSSNGCFNKTTADAMVIVSESEKKLYIMTTKSLKTFVEDNKDHLKFRTTPGSNSAGFLVPVSALGDKIKVKHVPEVFN